MTETRQQRKRLPVEQEQEVITLYSTTDTPVAEIKRTYELTNGGMYSLLRRHDVTPRTAQQARPAAPPKPPKPKHVPVKSSVDTDPTRHAFDAGRSTPNRCRACGRALSRHVTPPFAFSPPEQNGAAAAALDVAPNGQHSPAPASTDLDEAADRAHELEVRRRRASPRELKVNVAANGLVESVSTRKLPEHAEWIVKFTGEITVNATSIDHALSEARKLGVVRRIYSARMR